MPPGRRHARRRRRTGRRQRNRRLPNSRTRLRCTRAARFATARRARRSTRVRPWRLRRRGMWWRRRRRGTGLHRRAGIRVRRWSRSRRPGARAIARAAGNGAARGPRRGAVAGARMPCARPLRVLGGLGTQPGEELEHRRAHAGHHRHLVDQQVAMRIVQGRHGVEEAGARVALQHSSQGFGRVRRELQGVVLARRDVRALGAHVAFRDRAALQQRERAFGRCPQQRAEVFHPFRRERRHLGVKAGAASERRRKLTQFRRLSSRTARDLPERRRPERRKRRGRRRSGRRGGRPRRVSAATGACTGAVAVASRRTPAPSVRQCARHADSSARTPPRWLTARRARVQRPAAANRQRADRALRPDRTSDPDASAAQPAPPRARRRARTCRCAGGRPPNRALFAARVELHVVHPQRRAAADAAHARGLADHDRLVHAGATPGAAGRPASGRNRGSGR